MKIQRHFLALTFLTLCLLLFSSLSVYASHQAKVVLHLSDPHKLHVLVNNVNNIRQAYGDQVDIVVVVNGPAVTRFGKVSNTDKQVKAMLDQDAEVSVCSIAMKNRDFPPDQLIDGVTYLKQGGVARLIELQQQGYSYIKI